VQVILIVLLVECSLSIVYISKRTVHCLANAVQALREYVSFERFSWPALYWRYHGI